ncbi:DUF6427 family protein [Mesonia aquimarina]|uniref:DUF6427 family protein n=1 Tax=Mesonia aquimarina TaxID=1504967 RepID=UPI0013CE6EEB|nr:DUF6427 family protein [Mesonia aquimarina]
MMLTSFFRKSKPIHFLLVGILMTVFFCIDNFFLINDKLDFIAILKNVAYLLVYLGLMLIINFIVKRSGVTKRNTFTIILFALFSLSFVTVLQAEQLLLSAFFLLLALRRIISLQTGMHQKQKIFDTTFWLGIATILYPPCAIFLLIPFVGILFYTAENVKTWLIPFVALTCVFILNTAVQLLLKNQFFELSDLSFTPALQFDLYRKLEILIPLSVLLTFSLWTLFNYLNQTQKSIKKQKKGRYLVFVTWMLSILVVAASPQNSGAEILFYILPVSIIGASYFEQKGEKWFKEILLISLVFMSLCLPFLV